MAWASSGSILLSSDWQYTEPIPTGSFFRLKHTEAPNGGLFAIAQCEIDDTGKLYLFDSQVLAVEKPITDVLRFSFPGCFAERRIAIKKLPKKPSLQQELRRLFLPGYLQPTEEEIRIVPRSNWSIEVEVSDIAESTEIDLSPIQTALDAISLKIDNLQQSNGSTGSGSSADPYFNNVALLMHVDSTGVFADEKGKAVSVFGDARIDATQSKFGGACAYFDGSSDYLRLENSDDFHFASNDFTIECWIKLEIQEARDRAIIAKVSPNQAAFILNINPQNKVTFSSEGYTGIVSNNALQINTWNHVAVARNAGTVKLFIDGIEQASGSFPNSPQYANPVYIGAFDPTNPSYAFWYRGWIDELRITKGIARYTSNFAPTNTSFPNN